MTQSAVEQMEDIIFSGFKSVTDNQLRAIIEAEISKEVENINLNFIDTCFTLLEIREENRKSNG